MDKEWEIGSRHGSSLKNKEGLIVYGYWSLLYLLMNKKGYSYFSRHQKITKSKYESKDPVPPSPPPSQK